MEDYIQFKIEPVENMSDKKIIVYTNPKHEEMLIALLNMLTTQIQGDEKCD